MPKQQWVVGLLVAVALLASCGSGEATRAGPLDATSTDGDTNEAGTGDVGTNADAVATCQACSVDTDCRTSCPPATPSGYVWCCGFGQCFRWANVCPPLAVDAGGGGSPPDSSPDAPPDDGGLLNASTDCQPSGVHGGHRWQDLYACYFGPTGNVSCGSMTGCHSQSSDPGATASNFVCGSTQDACWQSLTTSIAPSDGASDPTMARLYGVLCKSDGSGIMPPGCPQRLLTGDLARVAAWIQEGVPNN